MRIVFFVSFTCMHFFRAEGQLAHSRWKENFDVNEFKIKTIEIPAADHRLPLQHFSGFSVIDARADTGRIGLLQKKIIDPVSGAFNNAVRNQEEQKVNARPTFVKLKNGTRQQSEYFVNNYLSVSADNALPSVLMVIKKLWLSDELNFNEQRQTDLAGTKSKDVWTSGVDVKAEFYLKQGTGYYALYRYDSVITKATTISEYGPQFIQLALLLALQKMKEMDLKVETILQKRKFTLEEIIQHNEDAFNIPVLKDSVLKAGVYFTFEEFKNNNPSQKDYELKKDKLTDVVYINGANGEQHMERGVWGYCDGEKAYIKSANNFFILQKYANAFYVHGAKHLMIENEHTGASSMNYVSDRSFSGGGYWRTEPGYSFRKPKRMIKLEPFQLDWSTGKLY